MTIVLNRSSGGIDYLTALSELFSGADSLAIACSYLQPSGWAVIAGILGERCKNVRIVCTDQFSITHPEAIRNARAAGAQVRLYSGQATYHPKVYISCDGAGCPAKYLIGSGNMSYPAYTSSVEAGILGSGGDDVISLAEWYEDLFKNFSIEITDEKLRQMDLAWNYAASERAKRALERVSDAGLDAPIEETQEVAETLEDVFANLKFPIGMLNIDHAGNNVRSLGRLCDVLSRWAVVSIDPDEGKARSELRLLGFASGADLTPLGNLALADLAENSVARHWAAWLINSSDVELSTINPKLTSAKRVFNRFWQLHSDVRDFFLANVNDSESRLLLQTIELLCNAERITDGLGMPEVRALSYALNNIDLQPPTVREGIQDYFSNKGTRGWTTHDRRILPIAFRDASANE